jgi:hypothetical protein
MKRILFLLFVLMLFGCNKDEPYDKYQKIHYNYVLNDQTKSVIMPLHIGNTWIYHVTEYDDKGNISKEFDDTIYVEKEHSINNEIWYDVSWFRYNSPNIRTLTNTNVGLIEKTDCDSIPNLVAEFPVTHNTYLVCKNDYYPILIQDPIDTTKTIVVFAKLYIWCNVESVKQYSVPAGTYDCYKYTDWGEMVRDTIYTIYNPIEISYFTPDLGLIKEEWYQNEILYRDYELISYELIK